MNTQSIFPIGPEDKKNLERGEDAPIPAPNRPPNSRKNFPQMMKEENNKSTPILAHTPPSTEPHELTSPFPFKSKPKNPPPKTSENPFEKKTEAFSQDLSLPISPNPASPNPTSHKARIPIEMAAINAFLKKDQETQAQQPQIPNTTHFPPIPKQKETPPTLDTTHTTQFPKQTSEKQHLHLPAPQLNSNMQAQTQENRNIQPQTQENRNIQPQTLAHKEIPAYTQEHALQNSKKQRQILEETLHKERRPPKISQNTPYENTNKNHSQSSQQRTEKTRPDGSETQEIATETTYNGEIEPLLTTHSNSRAEALQKLVNQLIDKLYNIRQTNGRIDTTITLKGIQLFEGATVTITEFDTSAGELNLSFENLSSDARSFLEQNASELRQKLEDNGHIVHQIQTTEQSNEHISKSEQQNPFKEQQEEQEKQEQEQVAEEDEENETQKG
jgi:hypothetical protein